jgi:hypothetical protein
MSLERSKVMNQPTESYSALRSVLIEKTERRTGTLLQRADHTIEACDPIALKTGVPHEAVTIGLYQPSGQLIWLEVSATPLFKMRFSSIVGTAHPTKIATNGIAHKT